VAESVAGIVFAEAERALDSLERELAETRSRAALMFTLAGISSSVLVDPALRGHQGVPALGIAAIALAVGSIVCALVVLVPRPVHLAFSPAALRRGGWATLDAEQLIVKLTDEITLNVAGLRPRLNCIWWLVRTSMALALASVTFWIALLVEGP
jgi:hypothetical protein